MPILKRLIVIINLPRLLLHLFFFGVYFNKCKDDVRVNIASCRFPSGCVWGFLYLLVFHKTFRNLYYWRIGNAKYLMWYLLWPHPCFTIASDIKLGKGVLCVHPFASVINADSIGDGFIVRNCVTIGNNKSGERPTIGSNVCVNANAVIIGKIRIGNNVVVGAGSVVTKDIPDNCVVVGNPAFILKENGIIVKRKL